MRSGHTVLILLSVIASIIVTFVGCAGVWDNSSGRDFTYKRYLDGISRKNEVRHYRWRQDTISEEVIVLDSLMKVLNRETKTLLRIESGLDILIKTERIPFLRLDSKTCTRFVHPMGFITETCFKKRLDYKGHDDAFEFTEEHLVIDGGKHVVYLDKDYAMIDKISIGVATYDSIVRVNQ